MGLNIVTSTAVVNYFKKSRFFRQNLGLVSTVEKNGGRVFNDKDKFALHYNSIYRTTIFAQGNVGDIRFYVDFYVRGSQFAVYSGDNFEEFIYDFDANLFNQKGVDFYLGHIIKNTEERYEEMLKNNELKKLEPKPLGNAEKVLRNPGDVNYEDLKAYINKRNAERYKNLDL